MRGKPNLHIFFSISPLIIGVLILFGPIIFTGKAIFWGVPSLQFVPWWVRAWENIQGGMLPLWNPDVGMGAPLIANYQLAFFYPLNWLYLLAALIKGAVGIAWTQAIIIAFQITWAGLGMFFLARELNFTWLGQIISSLSFALSGYLISRAWFLSINAAIAWLPWILYASYRLVSGIREQNPRTNRASFINILKLRCFWLLALFIGLQLLAGHAQTSWYTLVFMIAWVLFWAAAPKNNIHASDDSDKYIQPLEPSRLKGFAWVLLITGIAMIFGIALAAIQLLPTAEYLLQSSRSSAVDYELAMTYSFWPWRFIGLIAPNAFGNPAYGNYWGYANYWEDAIYIGLIPIILAIRTLFSKEKRYLKWFLVGVILISFVFALGKNTPIFPFLYKYVPTFAMFQAPTRWSILAVVSLCLLAGMGAGNWERPAKKGLYWTRLSTAGAFAITIGAGLGWLLLRNQADVVRLQTFVLAIGLAGLLAIGGGLLALSAPNSPIGYSQMSWWSWIVIFWIVIDLVVAGWGLNPAGTIDIYRQVSSQTNSLSKPRVYMPSDSESELKYRDLFRFDTFFAVSDWTILRQTYLADINILDRLRSVNNYDPLLPERTVNWINLLDHASGDNFDNLLNLSNVSVVVKKDLSRAEGVVISPVDPGAYLRWYSCADFKENGQEVLTSIQDNPLHNSQVVLLEGTGSSSPSQCDASGQISLKLIKNTAQRKSIQIHADQPGWLMLSETWYPGWRAELDSEQVDILRANYQFQAVAVPEGSHQLEIYYDPGSIKMGWVISSVTLLLFIAAFWVKWKII